MTERVSSRSHRQQRLHVSLEALADRLGVPRKAPASPTPNQEWMTERAWPRGPILTDLNPKQY